MTTVNNATGVYGTLGYNFSDPNGDILTLSENTLSHMNSMPAFITSNQANSMVAAGTGAISQSTLYQNPVVSAVQNMWTTANAFIAIASNTCDSGNSLINVATTLSSTANSFIWHTNRLSNLVVFDGTDTVNPNYTQAMSFGKIAIYITNQTDGITNTSPTLGSFTSLFIGPQLNANSTIISSDYVTYSGDIIANTATPTQYQQIQDHMNTASSLMSTRQSADVSFFNNLKNMINNYGTTKQFQSIGESQSYLITNFIGTANAINLMNS
jgi:hypothetical protein